MQRMSGKPLAGKVALVTGAGRNIGRAIALALADAGAKVVVNVRANRDEGEAVVNEIVARGGKIPERIIPQAHRYLDFVEIVTSV